MPIYEKYNGFLITLDSRTVKVTGTKERDLRLFAGAARHASPNHPVTRWQVSDARLSDERTVVYTRANHY